MGDVREMTNLFPLTSTKRMEIHNLNAVLIHVMDDGSLHLSLAVSDDKLKKRLLDVANEVMYHGIAPFTPPSSPPTLEPHDSQS